MVLYNLFVYKELFSEQKENQPKPLPFSSLNNARVEFLEKSHSELSSYCIGSDFKYLFWLRNLLVKFVCKEYLLENGEEEGEENDDINQIDDNAPIEMFDRSKFDKLFADIINCLYNIQLLPSTSMDYSSHNQMGSRFKPATEDMKYLLVAIIYFEDSHKMTKSLSDALKQAFSYFSMISNPTITSSKRNLIKFINGEIGELKLQSSSSNFKKSNSVAEEEMMMNLIYHRCYLLFATKLQHEDEKDRYDLIINAIAMDYYNIEAWNLLGTYYTDLIETAIDDLVAKSSKIPDDLETNIKRTIQILRRICAITKEKTELIQAWYNMGKLFYTLCHFKGKDSVMWHAFLKQSLESFTKVQELSEGDDWEALTWIGKIKEKLFYTFRKFDLSDQSEMFNQLNEFLSCYEQAIQSNSKYVDGIYRLHASRYKILQRSYHILNDEQKIKLCSILFKYQYSTEDCDSTYKDILVDCDKAFQSLNKDHRAIYLV